MASTRASAKDYFNILTQCLFAREWRALIVKLRVQSVSSQLALSLLHINYEESQQVLMHKSNDGDEDHFKIPFVRFL